MQVMVKQRLAHRDAPERKATTLVTCRVEAQQKQPFNGLTMAAIPLIPAPRIWLIATVTVALLVSVAPSGSEAANTDSTVGNGRQCRSSDQGSVFELFLRSLRMLFGGACSQPGSFCCRPVTTAFGKCNNSWADMSAEEKNAEADAAEERRAQYNITMSAELRQPLREIGPDASAQYRKDLSIDPEWSSMHNNLSGYSRTLARTYLTQDLPASQIDSFQEYANISKYLQNAFTNNPPVGAKYRPWALDPANDPNFTDSNRWADDQLFANARVSGLNSVNIYRIGSRGLPLSTVNGFLNKDGFDWDAAIQDLSGFTYRQAVLRKRLFAQYHPKLRGIAIDEKAQNPSFAGQSFSHAPFVVFVLPRREKLFRVVAVQLGYNKSSLVYSPTTSPFFWWTYAKAIANAANTLHAQMVLHLHDAHFTGARFALATQRELPPSHAVRKLMDYHFRGMHQVNTLSFASLIHPEGSFAMVSLVGHSGNMELVAKGYEDWHYRKLNPQDEAAYRGVQSLPYYPYYHDAVRMFRVLRQYADGFVRLHFCCDEQVRKDDLLQRWVQAAATVFHRGTKGVPDKLCTIGELVDYLTHQIWLYTGYHAANNFPAAEYAMYMPVGHVGLALHPDQVDETLAAATSLDNLDYLIQQYGSRLESVTVSATVLGLVGMKFSEIIDQSEAFQTGRTAKLANFVEKKLENLERRLVKENIKRRQDGLLTYKYLQPSEVIGSISI